MATTQIDAAPKLIDNDALYNSLPLEQGQTRVLRLIPGPRSSRLEGQLMVVGISDHGKTTVQLTGEVIRFTALSYTWGTGRYCDNVALNGHRVDVKENLADFLYECRTTVASGDCAYIWIDALCINQNDSDEKSRQVAAMRTFYSTADQVIVWLGKAGRYTPKAVEYFRENEAKAIKGSSPLSRGDVDALHHDGTLYGLVDVYSRQWSTRIWIKQEVWAARYVAVWCGAHRWHPHGWASFGAALFLVGEDDLLSTRLKQLGLDAGATSALLGLEWGPPVDRPPRYYR